MMLRLVIAIAMAIVLATGSRAQTFQQPDAVQLRAYYCLSALHSQIVGWDKRMDELATQAGAPPNRNFSQRQTAERIGRLLRFVTSQGIYNLDQSAIIRARLAGMQDARLCELNPVRCPNGIKTCNGDLLWLPY